MQHDRQQQIGRICQEALELDQSQRAAFLEEASGGIRPRMVPRLR